MSTPPFVNLPICKFLHLMPLHAPGCPCRPPHTLLWPLLPAVCTAIMTALYTALGAVGYQSKGTGVAEIVIFSLGTGPWARFAAACILLQALSQCEH